jgi:type I restriction enzyme S subunit
MADQTARNVPLIRFKQFEDQWQEDQLGQQVEFFSGLTYSPRNVQKGVGTLVLRSSNVKNGEIVSADNVYVDPSVVNSKYIEVGDIAVVVRNGSRSLIGKHAQIKNKMDAAVIGAFMTGIQSKTPNFINALLDTSNFNKEIGKNLGATINQITTGAFKQMMFRFPGNPERVKVGAYFCEIDQLIALHQRKHDKLAALKKAMLQKMFPKPGAAAPEIRFKGFVGDWAEMKLGDCVLIQRGGSPRPIESFITREADGINWVKIGDVKIGSRYITKTDEKIKPEGVSKSREVFKGDLILSNSMSFGRPYLMAIDGCIHDGWLLIRNNKNLFDMDYLLQLLSSEAMTHQYRSLAAGGVVNNLNSALVQSTDVSFPDKAEQQKIGTYFRTLDELIAQHATQLQKLQQIKSACLEKMFV